MSREIKFRVWDKDCESMDDVFDMRWEKDVLWVNGSSSLGIYPLMQYTGNLRAFSFIVLMPQTFDSV